MKDYYEILGILPTSTIEQIKKAYRINAIKFHPDKNNGDQKFAEAFIEIKEAYDILSDSEKRKEYDVRHKSYFKPESNSYRDQVHETTRKKETERETFRYDPHKPFYSAFDREQQETPQFNPKSCPWGGAILGDFFILPKRIGKLIGGFSNMPSPTASKTFIAKLKEFFISPTYINYFIGINGFAIYRCKGKQKTIVENVEINFNSVTDVISRRVIQKRNFVYVHTEYQYIWMNRTTNKIIYQITGTYRDEDNMMESIYQFLYPDLAFNIMSEKYWSVHLLDNMEKQLEEKGFIDFNVLHSGRFIPFIKIGIGYITFLNGTETFTYNFNEIKKIYAKGTELYVEHNNFEKKLFFFKSGNQNSIPLHDLCNRQFFFKALEILLGYKLN